MMRFFAFFTFLLCGGAFGQTDKCAPILHVIQNMANTPCGQNFCQIYGNGDNDIVPPAPTPPPKPVKPTFPTDDTPMPIVTEAPLTTRSSSSTQKPTPKPLPPTLPTKATTSGQAGGPWGVDSSSTWWGSEDCKCKPYPGQSGWNCQGQCYTTQAECVDAQFNEKHCKNKVMV